MLQAWFEILFKYPGSLYRQADWVLETAPGDRLAWFGAAIVLVLAAALWRRRAALPGVRAACLHALQVTFLALAVLVLLRPALEVMRLTPGSNQIAVLVDTSQSMGLGTDGTDPSRLAQARRILDDTLLPRLRTLGEVVPFSFAGRAVRDDLAALEPGGPRTRLVAALDTVLSSFRGQPLAGVVVLSDGADNDPSVDLPALSAAGVPVHVVAIGPGHLAGEVQLDSVSVPAEAAPHSRVIASVLLRHESSGTAQVTVHDGARLIASEPVSLHPGASTERIAVAFDSGPGGIRELTFAVEPPPGDVLAPNNSLSRLLTVHDARRRVLYLEGAPRWEYKFLRRALEGDAMLALTSWLRTTERKTYRQDVVSPEQLRRGFPATRAELYNYDVVVLGSLAATDLDDVQHAWLEAYVGDRGGSLLALAGPEALADGGWDVRPLADALPVVLDRSAGPTYRAQGGAVRPTPAGRRSAVTRLGDGEGADAWDSLPELGDYQSLGALKPAASVLLEILQRGRSRPLLVSQPYGRGTAAVLASATTWRWRMRTPPDDPRHTLFWRQLVRQLAMAAQQQRELAVSLDGEQARVVLSDRDADFEPRADLRATATISGADRDALPLRLEPGALPGTLEGRFRPSVAGVYRVDVQPPGGAAVLTRFVSFGQPRLEYLHPLRDDALLRRIAGATGGRYWRPEDVAGIADALALSSAGVRHRERMPVWDMPALFLLMLLVKCGEWWLRRRWGSV